MNRIAGYSYYEKTPPDYDKALAYMEELFKTVAPERIITERLSLYGKNTYEEESELSKDG